MKLENAGERESTFLQHIKKAYSFEENVIDKICYVMSLFLDSSQDNRKVTGVLSTLTKESKIHKAKLEGIIRESERVDV